MKSFSIDQTIVYVDIAQTLNNLQENPILQLSRPQKISPEILKEFERRVKKIKIITEDQQIYMTHIVSFNKSELVLRLPESLNIHLSKHLLLVFSGEGKEYVVQGFVRQFFFPMVVISYADPRLQSRWQLKSKENTQFYPAPEQMLARLSANLLQLVRFSSVIHPSGSSKTGELKKKILVIEDHICTGVVFDDNLDAETLSDPGSIIEKDRLVIDYEENPRAHAELKKYKVAGRIHDISPSGLGVLSLKGYGVGEVGALVYVDLPALSFMESKSTLLEFKVGLFGIVRYQRPFDNKDFIISGIKFIRTIDDLRFYHMLKASGSETGL